MGTLLLFLVGPLDASAQTKSGRRIAVVVDGPQPGIQKLIERTEKELLNFGYTDDSLFSKEKVLIGDYSLKTALAQLDRAGADPDIDVVWAFGLVASAAAVQRATTGQLNKPVLAPFVLAPASEALAKLDASKSKLSYVIWTPALSRDLKALRSVTPVRYLAYTLPSSIREALPFVEAVLEAEAERAGVRLHFASDEDPRALVEGLPADIGAVFVGPQPRWRRPQFEALAAALIARRLPSFAQAGRPLVEFGLLMGLGGPENAERLARAVAVNTDAILQGEAPGELSYVFQQVESLVVNAATSDALGLSLSWAVVSEAELIGKRSAATAKKIGLYQVVQEVRERNLELQANEQELAASEESVREAVGALLPALDASLSGRWVDPDGANSASPERTASWSASASQVVVNEPALAQLTIRRRLRDATRFDNQTAILDKVQSASIGYLNVLAAIVGEQIQRDNLKVTRKELAQARVRKESGFGSRSEVVRLENQLATNRKNVIDAVASRNVTEIELLRLLNRASEESFVPEDVSLESSQLMATGDRLQSYMTGPDRFDVLRNFMAAEALRNSPELKAGELRIAAKKREALSNQLAPFVPQIAVNGSVTHLFATGGEGTQDDAPVFLPLNPFNWQVGFTASLRIWEGNARYARTARSRAEAQGQALDLEAFRIQIQARIRSALHRAGASYAAIALQREAAELADENLALVQEAFARGKQNIITLVDAQNQALAGRLNANTAVYEFLSDLLEVQRAMGRFDFSMSKADVDDFFERLKAFAAFKETDRD